MHRVLPHPFLTLVLTLTWCLVTNTFSLGNVVAGLIFGVVLPIFTRPWWPDRPRRLRVVRLAFYVVLVIWDIAVANVAVAWIVLTRSNPRMRSAWVTIPLDIRTPEAITILAGTITLTPGTVAADLSDEGHALLVHALDTPDPEATARDIKNRYERRLKRIFE